MAAATVNCVACRGDLSPFGRRLNYEYRQCSKCGTIQLAPLPNENELAEAYAKQYSTAAHYEENPETAKISARNYYRSITRVLKDYDVSGPVVDYGAGWGGLCRMLIDNGFECSALEISEDMAAYCRKQGLPVNRGGLEALDGKENLAALVLCTVFEHLVNHDTWMQSANRAIMPGGLLVSLQPTAPFADFIGRLVRLGNLDKPLPSVQKTFSPPWHTVQFSFEGMRILASRNGFELIDVRPAPQGREKGLIGIAQVCLELINRLGWKLVGRRWPLLIAHIFILRKVPHDD